VNRTDRLYALVEELRAGAPRARTASQLAATFEVSVRTIERDLGALMEAGVPIYATPGPGGGYAVDRRHTLPPVNFTPGEAMAVAVALARSSDALFAGRLRAALHKVVAAMSESDAERARALSARVRLMSEPITDAAPPAVVQTVEDALLHEAVLEISYEDITGAVTNRVIEPVAVVARDEVWYLVAHCRLRDAGRSFRLDRVMRARPTGERSPERDFDAASLDMPANVRRLPFLE
jgi:predicted DNA-binding transcriptional regulator YafY